MKWQPEVIWRSGAACVKKYETGEYQLTWQGNHVAWFSSGLRAMIYAMREFTGPSYDPIPPSTDFPPMQ